MYPLNLIKYLAKKYRNRLIMKGLRKVSKNEVQKESFSKLEAALKNGEAETFHQAFIEMHPYEQSVFFMKHKKKVRMQIYEYLSPSEVAEMIHHITMDEAVHYFIEMDPRYAAMVFELMATDDAADIFNQLNSDQVASFLTLMDADSAENIKKLLHYEEKTAGSIMTTEYVAFIKSDTVKSALTTLKKVAPDAETIYYLYVLDEAKRIVGVLSLRDLIVAEDDTLIEEIMNENIVSVSVGNDQEAVAKMMRDYDFLALPVVDFQNHLLGIITVDDIIDVIDEEAIEDYSKFAGVTEIDFSDQSPVRSAQKRLPWLIILLFLGMFTASLIGQFEETLEKVALLAIFIPLIAGMAGNAGTQSLAVAVRGLATGEYGKQGKMKLMIREALTGLMIGAVCGGIITLVIYIWKGELFLGILVGISILATLFVATLSGSFIPLLMTKLKIDPAVASGPFITTINDIISILIYFGIATAFMSLLL